MQLRLREGRPRQVPDVTAPSHPYTCGCFVCLIADHRPGKVSRIVPSQVRTEAGTARKRAQRACTQCHRHKTKCTGEQPVCKRCAVNNLDCEYGPSKRKFSSAPGSQTPTGGPRQESARDVESQHASSPRAGASHEPRQLVSPSASSLSPGLTDSNRRTSGVLPLAEYTPRSTC